MKFFVIAFFLFCSDYLFSQANVDVAAAEYLDVVGNRSLLYYGKAHIEHPRATNHPYMYDSQFTNAYISYRGVSYPNVWLRLDLANDEMIIRSPGHQSIVLSPQYVDFVRIHGQTVIYFGGDNLKNSPSAGYYALLHAGKCTALRKERAYRTFAQSSARYTFQITTNYFLLKDDTYHIIRNKRAFYKILYPHKTELKRFVASNNLNFRRNTSEFISLTLQEYEKLFNYE
jgi:hypothetical protein